MTDNPRTCLFRVSSPNSCSMPPEATGHGASIPLIPQSMAVVTLSYVRLNYADTGSHPLWQLWGLPPYFCRGPLCGDHDKFAAAFSKGEPIIDDVGLDVGAKPRRVRDIRDARQHQPRVRHRERQSRFQRDRRPVTRGRGSGIEDGVGHCLSRSGVITLPESPHQWRDMLAMLAARPQNELLRRTSPRPGSRATSDSR